MIAVGLVLAIAALVAAVVPGPDTFGRWALFLMVGPLAANIVGAVVPNWVCRPYRFGVVDAGRRIVKFSAKNPAYTELIIKRLGEADGIAAR
jgi:hypothetical protein